MSARQVGVLLGKEARTSSRGFLFIMAVFTPLVVSLAMALLFGTFFSGRPRLAIADEGNSQLVARAAAEASITTRTYAGAGALRAAVGDGTADLGIVLPADFDAALRSGRPVVMTAYVWGESLARDRLVLGAAVTRLAREIVGQEAPIEISTVNLGEAAVGLADRMLPFVVLLAVILGGTMVPASSLVEERQSGTLRALMVTPSRLLDVVLAKALLGAAVSLFMGLATLALNRAIGSQPGLLVFVLALGAVFAAEIGVVLGLLAKDVTTLFAVVKGLGLLLYAPAIVLFFPSLPEWIGRIFPTYYVVAPVMALTQAGGGWADIALDVGILIALILIMLVAVGLLLRRARLALA